MTTLIHAPGNTHRIDAIWAAISIDDGGEGLCAMLLDGAWTPLIAGDERRLEWLVGQARVLAKATGKRIKIIKLTSRIEVGYSAIWRGAVKGKFKKMRVAHTLGDGPVQEEYVRQMTEVVRTLDMIFNGKVGGPDRKTGFILMVFPFDSHEGRCNYMSNGARREDVVVMMKEQIKRFEGQPEVKGNA
jgi:hypothetical protein